MHDVTNYSEDVKKRTGLTKTFKFKFRDVFHDHVLSRILATLHGFSKVTIKR